MLLLSVDTSTQSGSLAVLCDNRVLGEVATWVEETYSSRMFRHLEFLLRELSLQMSGFDLYAVAAGPGSFTGLRVGLTAVKGWAEVYGKPIAAVSALEAVAEQSRAQLASALLASVIDARRGQIYAGIYQPVGASAAGATVPAAGLRLVGEEMVLTPVEFFERLPSIAGNREVVFVTPTPDVLVAPLANSPHKDCPIEQVSTVLAPVIGQLGYLRAQQGELTDALRLDANYIRRSDAELLWKGQP